MSEAAIRAAFETRLKTWADAQKLPVAFENAPFSVPASGRYLSAHVLPARTISLSLDRKHRQYKGIYQVSIVMPADTGPGAAEALIDAIDGIFSPSSPPMIQAGVSIVITSPMSAGVPIQETDSFMVPVTAQYEADIVRP